MGSIWRRYRGLRWGWQLALALLVCFVMLGAAGAATPPSPRAGAKSPAHDTSTTVAHRTTTTAERTDEPSTTTTALLDTDGDTAGSAPTIDGAPVAAGSGALPGSAACRTGNPLANVYHPDRLTVLAACKTVTGTVRSVRHESDGDYHIALEVDPAYQDTLNAKNVLDQNGWLVVEVIPADEPSCVPGQPPR